MEKFLPTYKIVVNPDDDTTGVYAVSLVDEPAIEVDWIALSKHISDYYFQANKDKQMLFGPLLIPNKLIYRRDEKGNEYNIVFDEETIQIIADKYNENKLGDVFNFQHSNEKVEATLLQNWITGEVDKSQEMGFELPKGTWFGGVKVKNEKFWLEEVKTGLVKGFSVEIKAGTELIEMCKECLKDEGPCWEGYEQIGTKIVDGREVPNCVPIDKKQMTTEVDKNKINLMEVKTRDGLTLTWDGDAEIGKDIFIILEDGTKSPLADGEYELEDGTKIVAQGGKVAEIMAPEAPSSEDMQEPVATPDVLEAVKPLIEELRGIIAELSTRIDKLENVETVVEESNDEENYSKIKELEEKVEMLSKMAGATSITKKSDREVEAEKRENVILNKIMFYKQKSTK